MTIEKEDIHSILITNSALNTHTGGGVVSLNILRALQKVSVPRIIHLNEVVPDNQFEGIEAICTSPMHWGYAPETLANPFFQDYLSEHLIPDEPLEIGVTYGCPMGNAVAKLKRGYFCKVFADLAPHNIQLSMEEHKAWGQPFNYPHLINEKIWKLYSRHLRIADVVITHSKQGAAYIKEKAELTTDPVIIPHGCYLPDVIPPFPEEIRPGYFGAISADKGSMYLFNAWIHNPHSENHQILLGGWGTQGFAVGPTYADKFRIIGPVDHINEFYNQVSFLVVPSVTEGFGISVLEAMAHGRPVICAEGAGAVDMVNDGVNGLVVPIRNTNAINTAIDYLYDNPDEIKRMGKNARKTAEDNTWEKIIEQYATLFKRY